MNSMRACLEVRGNCSVGGGSACSGPVLASIVLIDRFWAVDELFLDYPFMARSYSWRTWYLGGTFRQKCRTDDIIRVFIPCQFLEDKKLMVHKLA